MRTKPILKERLGKAFLVSVLRRARITKEVAGDLHDLIKESVLEEVYSGNTVSLFGIANIVPYKHQGLIFKGFVNKQINDKNFRIKAIINRTVKTQKAK
jgi:hypothetical protein